MSLAMALRAADGLVLASDSRVTSQEERRDTSEKFLQVNRDIGVLTYGAAVPGYGAITELVEETKQHEYSTFDQIKEAAAEIFREELNRYFEEEAIPEKDKSRIGLGFILGGYDHVSTNQFRIVSYKSPRFEAREILDYPPTFAAARWHISEYLLNKIYYPEITVKQLAEMAVFLLLETTTVEETVGGPIQLATVTLEQGFQRLHPDDIRELIERNQHRICAFRRFLLDILDDMSNGVSYERSK